MYILHRVAKFVGDQYTSQTRPQKINWFNFFYTTFTFISLN